MIDAIYVDLDGVLGDFVSAAFLAHKKDPIVMYKAWTPGDYEALPKLCEVDEKGFWDGINDYRPEWMRNGGSSSGGTPGAWIWENEVKAYPWADLLWNMCEERAETWVMTSPARSAGSAYGKVKWLQAWKGEAFRKYVIAPNKAHLSRKGALLIDDDPKNVAKWAERGGETIQFPRLWNPRFERADRPMETVIPELLKYEFAGKAKD